MAASSAAATQKRGPEKEKKEDRARQRQHSQEMATPFFIGAGS
jgi:hypothetical protein